MMARSEALLGGPSGATLSLGSGQELPPLSRALVHTRHVLSYGTRQTQRIQDKGDACVHVWRMAMVCINVLIMKILQRRRQV